MSKIMEYYENIAREEGRAEGFAESFAEGFEEGRAEVRKEFEEVRKKFAEELRRKDEEIAALRAQIAALQRKKEASLFDDLREGLSEAIDYEKGELPARKTTLTILPADSLSASDTTVSLSGNETAFDEAATEELKALDSDV